MLLDLMAAGQGERCWLQAVRKLSVQSIICTNHNTMPRVQESGRSFPSDFQNSVCCNASNPETLVTAFWKKMLLPRIRRRDGNGKHPCFHMKYKGEWQEGSGQALQQPHPFQTQPLLLGSGGRGWPPKYIAENWDKQQKALWKFCGLPETIPG